MELSHLPNDCVSEILLHCNLSTCLLFSQTCKRFLRIVKDDALWELHSKKDFPKQCLRRMENETWLQFYHWMLKFPPAQCLLSDDLYNQQVKYVNEWSNELRETVKLVIQQRDKDEDAKKSAYEEKVKELVSTYVQSATIVPIDQPRNVYFDKNQIKDSVKKNHKFEYCPKFWKTFWLFFNQLIKDISDKRGFPCKILLGAT